MPYLLGMPAFAPLELPDLRLIALGSLDGHLLYGLTLGAAFVWLYRPRPTPVMAAPGELQRRST